MQNNDNQKDEKTIVYGCAPFLCSKAALFMMVEAGIPIRKLILYTGLPSVAQVIVGLTKMLSWKYAMTMVLTPNVMPGFARKRLKQAGFRNFDLKTYCEEHGIEIIECSNFNKEVDRIGQMDIFISLFNPHILKANFIERVKQLCINFHPSNLPNFGGTDPIFQMLLNDQKETMSTGHTMTVEIDEGVSVCKDKFSIEGKSRFVIWWEFLFVAIEQIKRLYANNWQFEPIANPELEYPYHSHPTKEELAEFEKKGKKFFKLSDFWNDKAAGYEMC